MRTALVTGPTSGIGREIALGLAVAGVHVVAAGRSESRLGQLVEEIEILGGSGEPLLLNLASLESSRLAGRQVEDQGLTIDILVNNAGVGIRRDVTEDGFQIQFGVNHLGHFMLVEHLRRTFRPGSRIISVTSAMHDRSQGIDFEGVLRRTPRWGGIDAYASSKLANILFARELARRQPDWKSYAVHPGMVDTGILPRWFRPLIRHRLLTPAQGADTVLWVALDDAPPPSGSYLARRQVRTPSAVALDDSLARELWVRSERWCGTNPLALES